ncbi:transposase family protein [Streptomyces sp. NPDC017638]|uniref:transposase family protein n=1 Tax=Streptomyces sp. NPDC017638 TaxID=3365004 RepID=UPI0037B8D053
MHLRHAVTHDVLACWFGVDRGTEMRVRRPAAGGKDRDKFISGKSKQNAVKSMVVTDGDGRVFSCSPAEYGSCAEITHARQLVLARLLDGGLALEILADAGYQGLGAQTGGRVVTPPHRKFKKNVPDWYEETGGHWPATSAAASTSATRSKPLPVCCPTSQQRT